MAISSFPGVFFCFGAALFFDQVPIKQQRRVGELAITDDVAFWI